MKVSVLKENLSSGLNTVNRFVATRAQLPILSNVLLATDKGRLKISATNLETGINLWVGAKTEKNGAITIPARIFSEFVSSLPTEKVDLEVKNNQLFLTCGANKADFIGLPASEFPLVPSLTSKANISFNKQAFSEAINLVAFAAAADEGRPTLTGVLLMINEGKLVLVATDGYRLSMKKMIIPKEKEFSGMEKIQEFEGGLILPARTLSEVSKISHDSKDEALRLAITPESNQVIFALGEVEIVSRLIEGKFPEFEKIIPEKGSTKIILDTENLIRAVKMASIFARESANIIKFQITNSKLQISANTAQVGSQISEIEAKIEGEKSKIAFNSRYLTELLNVIDTPQTILEISGALNPGVFYPQGDDTYLHIIMPVRVQE